MKLGETEVSSSHCLRRTVLPLTNVSLDLCFETRKYEPRDEASRSPDQWRWCSLSEQSSPGRPLCKSGILCSDARSVGSLQARLKPFHREYFTEASLIVSTVGCSQRPMQTNLIRAYHGVNDTRGPRTKQRKRCHSRGRTTQPPRPDQDGSC